MPDISMCMNSSCPKRGECYRYRVLPNGRRQAYNSFTAHSEENPCRSFAEVRPGDPLMPKAQVDRRLAEAEAERAGTVGP